MSEESPRTRPSQPDSEDVEVATDDPIDPKAARRARRAKAKLALRIPDDEVVRPQAQSQPIERRDRRRYPRGRRCRRARQSSEARHDSIKPTRIISVGPPPPDPEQKEPEKQVALAADELKTQQRLPSAPPTAPIEEKDRLSSRPPPPAPAAPPTVIDAAEAAGEDIDVPVDRGGARVSPAHADDPEQPASSAFT